MSHSNSKNSGHEQGTMKSYAIGFLLSLLLTYIPYYMVVNKSVDSDLLLPLIVGIGLIQMVIQIIFFLHLGRGPKPNWNLYFFGSTFSIVLVVVGGSLFIINNLHYNMSPSDKVKKLLNDENIRQIGGADTGVCQQTRISHLVVIKDAVASPAYIDAQQCDTLTFINEDADELEISFGEHPAHEAYAGEDALVVRKGRNKTITLSETGSYKFHDHLNSDIAGDFTVSK